MRVLKILLFIIFFSFGVEAVPFEKISFLNLKEDLEEAKKEGKYLFIMFEQEECPFCDKMKRVTFQDPRVREYFTKHFYMVRIDIKGSNPVVYFDGTEMTEKELAHKFRVRATPHFVFFDHEGKKILSIPGYIPPEEFLLIGKYVAEGYYKKMSYFKFKRMIKKD
ncbi:thioredoxin family protein [Aquifex aeolicus]|uniref:Thioredoxin domain-containing protein n=1 Tax=Aquifex aeolicus (strain VF5) TaxID=224324 RepID=O67585_AQUAE|nr:thioredoxin fold domain-containing protein [Aquifex aeolicus]AAC07553.1 putative protein [Aquifex aeolicus VF5]